MPKAPQARTWRATIAELHAYLNRFESLANDINDFNDKHVDRNLGMFFAQFIVETSPSRMYAMLRASYLIEALKDHLPDQMTFRDKDRWHPWPNPGGISKLTQEEEKEKAARRAKRPQAKSDTDA